MTQYPLMDEERFWEQIEQSRAAAVAAKDDGDFLERQSKALTELLLALPAEEILAFDRRFHERWNALYHWSLWGAAYWLNGGCGDDGFNDFRSCVISLGRESFHHILADPDVLAEMVGRPDVPYLQSEGFQYVAARAYERKAGHAAPDEGHPPAPADPVGERWDFDDEAEAQARFPRIYERFPDMGD